jgi:tRNA threonylcarbamoyladenosine biosynthesis protein TsaB
MTIILALDTSTEACSAAVLHGDAVVERFETGSQHSRLILAMVSEVLAEAGVTLKQCDAIAFGRGPGSFTGLRIAAGAAQGLAFGADLPVAPISTLAALAQGANAPRVLAALDARMKEVYFGAFVRSGDGVVVPAGDELVIAPDAILLPDSRDWVGCGSGWDACGGSLRQYLGAYVSEIRADAQPHARDVARLATQLVMTKQLVSPEEAVPVYLRDEVVQRGPG